MQAVASIYDAKFTDRDVRENPELTLIAYDYLYGYGGDFSFLTGAKRALEVNGELSVPTIRGVLNCMRADPRAQAPAMPDRAQRRLRVVERQRPARVKMQAEFKLPYLTSAWPTARYSHLLRQDLTELWWFPHTGEYRWFPKVWCGQVFYTGTDSVRLRNTAEVPWDKAECARCVRARKESEGE